MYTGVTFARTKFQRGLLVVNQRTEGGPKYYIVTGAEEYSAMSSAEGAVQHLNYAATFLSNAEHLVTSPPILARWRTARNW